LEEQVVYVVDDDLDACRSIALMTQANGLKSETFDSAECFLMQVTSQPVGCLVTDIRMLGMSGAELLSELALRGWNLPTIVVTAYADVRLAVEIVRAGAITLLEKPCHEQELWTAITEALTKSKTEAKSIELQKIIRQRVSLLTPEELRVLEYMIDGVPNKVIASDLDIAPRTVDLRRQSVLKKMEAQCAIHVLRLINEAGMTPSQLLPKSQGNMNKSTGEPSSAH
jgi:two-component system response regulator FixJ